MDPYFGEFVIPYVNGCTEVARSLDPRFVNLIAPYNIKKAKCDSFFINQLEQLDIDIIAYQDGRSRIWADMELFYFEHTTYGNLIAADFESRIIHQMEAISPFVEKILVFQYLGIMNKPNSKAHAGLRDETVRLYNQYMNWYNKQNFK